MEKILNVKELLGNLTRGLFIERPNRFVGLVSVDRKIFKAHISDTEDLKNFLFPKRELFWQKIQEVSLTIS